MFANTGMLRTQVYDYLRDRLTDGTLKPGDLISCNKIAATLGVGRTPLRDALLQLQSDGFVEFFPQRGVQVREFNVTELLKLYEVCGALDAQVLHGTFDRLGPEEVRLMRQHHDVMLSCMQTGDNSLFVKQNIGFHAVYLDVCPNDVLVAMLRTVRQRLFEFSWDNWRTAWGDAWRRQNCEEHEVIMDLIERKRRDEAVRFLKDVHWSYNWEPADGA